MKSSQNCIKEKDLLKPKKIVSVREARGIAKHKVRLEDVKDALGRNLH